MQAWIVGASGLVGSALLELLLAEPSVQHVLAIVRRRDERTHPKLETLQVEDFVRLEGALAGRTATHAFCCLGTTMAKAGSREAFQRVDYEYPLAFGRAARAGGARKLLVVTALGADPSSRIFYNRVKGEVEAALGALALPELHLFRPSLLLGERAEHRRGEALGAALARPLGALLVGPLKRYRAIEGRDVARAMLAVGAGSRLEPGVHVHESDEIARIAAGAPAGHAG